MIIHNIFLIFLAIPLVSYICTSTSGPLVVGCCDVMIGKSKEGTLMRLFYPTSSQLPVSICSHILCAPPHVKILNFFSPILLLFTSYTYQSEPDRNTWTRWFLGPEVGYGVAKYTAPSFLVGPLGRLFNWQTRE